MITMFVLGAFGGRWWPGIEVDAPKPGGGDPWLTRLVMVAVGGISAIGLAQVQPIDIATVPGVFVALGAGKIGTVIVGAVLGALKR